MWPNAETITLATKPSSTAPGYLFFIDSRTGAENKILGAINGLTALTSSSTKNILYSESSDGSIKLAQVNTKTGLDRGLSFKTLPEKCVWSKKTTRSLTVLCQTLLQAVTTLTFGIKD